MSVLAQLHFKHDPLCSSHLLGTVGAVDVLSVDHKALVGQREAALLAVEAVLVPRESLIVHHVGAVAEPCGERRTAVSQQCETGNHASHTDLFKTFI